MATETAFTPTVPANAWSLCLWREARGEGHEGMRAVAWVIDNRSKAWGKSILEVLMQPNQFTSMRDKKQPDGTWKFEFPPDADPQWEDARQIVGNLLTGQDTEDPTDGALFYYNPQTADSSWFTRNIADNPKDHPQTVTIGRHVFFK
jgi:spore germination cell wall hydrolase CwlJ-like protein